jgi:class 3 adenylate cyclase
MSIRIGMCIHTGRFYEIAGGLYGADADKVEDLAEDCAGPGEILLTEEIRQLLRDIPNSGFERREFDRGEDGMESAWLLSLQRRMPDVAERDTAYPHPFPQEFFGMLSRLHLPDEGSEARAGIYSRWLRDKVVLFIAHHRGLETPGALGELLDSLVINALMETVIGNLADPATIASSAGGLAILTFDKAEDALEMGRAALARLTENGIPARVAIDAGSVLLLQNPSGASGIAGDPVNIASKLSEDIGRNGQISISDRAMRKMAHPPRGERFETRISNVQLSGLVLC